MFQKGDIVRIIGKSRGFVSYEEAKRYYAFKEIDKVKHVYDDGDSIAINGFYRKKDLVLIKKYDEKEEIKTMSDKDKENWKILKPITIKNIINAYLNESGSKSLIVCCNDFQNLIKELLDFKNYDSNAEFNSLDLFIFQTERRIRFLERNGFLEEKYEFPGYDLTIYEALNHFSIIDIKSGQTLITFPKSGSPPILSSCVKINGVETDPDGHLKIRRGKDLKYV